MMRVQLYAAGSGATAEMLRGWLNLTYGKNNVVTTRFFGDAHELASVDAVLVEVPAPDPRRLSGNFWIGGVLLARHANKPIAMLVYDEATHSGAKDPTFRIGRTTFDADVKVLANWLEQVQHQTPNRSVRSSSTVARRRATRPRRPQGRQIFISYSRADQKYVDKLGKRLRSENIGYWIDDKIPHGERFAAVIERQLERAIGVVVIMTPDAKQSTWVEREVQYAETLGIPVLPLLLSGPRWFRLQNLQDEDVRGGKLPSDRWFERIRTLAVPK